jgi:hypothetical protein
MIPFNGERGQTQFLKDPKSGAVRFAFNPGVLESGSEANGPFYTAPSGRLGAWQASQLGKFEAAQGRQRLPDPGV